MNLKKHLKSLKAQAIVEYIVIFIILAIGIVVIFGAFNPEKVGIRSVFDQTITKAISRINANN